MAKTGRKSFSNNLTKKQLIKRCNKRQRRRRRIENYSLEKLLILREKIKKKYQEIFEAGLSRDELQKKENFLFYHEDMILKLITEKGYFDNILEIYEEAI